MENQGSYTASAVDEFMASLIAALPGVERRAVQQHADTMRRLLAGPGEFSAHEFVIDEVERARQD